jgi:hypothetical protein
MKPYGKEKAVGHNHLRKTTGEHAKKFKPGIPYWERQEVPNYRDIDLNEKRAARGWLKAQTRKELQEAE